MSGVLARRKWLVRFEGRWPYGGWVVTAPSGERRWFFMWPVTDWTAQFFLMGEQSGLREQSPELFDAGVKV